MPFEILCAALFEVKGRENACVWEIKVRVKLGLQLNAAKDREDASEVSQHENQGR
jgi:hypothetical protein